MAKKWGEDQAKDESITCSLVHEPIIYIEPDARQKITLLMEAYNQREWLAYLVGRLTEKGNYFIEDISVPPHKESNYSSAEAEPFNIPEHDCVGIIHSHHRMGAFHSGTDEAYVDSNFPISIVVAKDTDGKLKYDSVSVTETPCGKTVKLECEVKYLQPDPGFDVESWLEESKKQIDKGQYVYNRNTNVQQANQKALEQFPGYTGYGFKSSSVNDKKDALPETTVKGKPPSWGDADKASDKRVITSKLIRKIRKTIHDNRGVVLCRSEIEDIIKTTPFAFAGMDEEDKSEQEEQVQEKVPVSPP